MARGFLIESLGMAGVTCYRNGLFARFFYKDDHLNLMTSPDGLTWTSRAIPDIGEDFAESIGEQNV